MLGVFLPYTVWVIWLVHRVRGSCKNSELKWMFSVLSSNLSWRCMYQITSKYSTENKVANTHDPLYGNWIAQENYSAAFVMWDMIQEWRGTSLPFCLIAVTLVRCKDDVLYPVKNNLKVEWTTVVVAEFTCDLAGKWHVHYHFVSWNKKIKCAYWECSFEEWRKYSKLLRDCPFW